MTGDQKQRVRRLFDLAAELPPGERAGFLLANCDDSQVRREVEALLAHEPAVPPDFLNEPMLAADGGAAGTRPLEPTFDFRSGVTVEDSLPGQTGRYRIVEKLGEGGFGVVYEAEQERPLRRRVALKVIKLGMDTQQLVRRFEGERQALARMDHPSIARVYDAGATVTGRPYFVMELVRGSPITRYCDEHSLPMRQRLELFIAVCHAVHHAHEKGVIHRDLKPTNVLVTTEAGQPAPKIIDFGIAKAMSAPLSDGTHLTEAGLLIGTPEYMSPEQAAGAGDTDTRSDVYSLGAVLYELLTGHTPFEARRLRGKPFGEIQRLLGEEDPPRPSTRIRGLIRHGPRVDATSTIQTIAEQRQTTPATLARSLRGDLDFIAAKCLARDRAWRYESAAALARDIEHLLAGRPLETRRDQPAYMLRKLFLQYWVPMAIAAGFVLLVGASSIVAWTLYVRAERSAASERRANQQATERLRQSYLDQARLTRRGGMAGQRLETLSLIEKAATIRPSLDLRNEAIAALALTDLQLHPPFATALDGWACPDQALEKCAIVDEGGAVRVISTAGRREHWQPPETQRGAREWPILSPDSRFLLTSHFSGDQVRRYKVWGLADSRVTLEIEGLPDDWIQMSPDSKWLALRREGGSVYIYDLETGAVRNQLQVAPDLARFEFDTAGHHLFAFSPDSHTVEMYALDSGQRLCALTNAQTVFHVAGHPGGRWLACGGKDGQIDLWDVPTGRHEGALLGHSSSVVALRFTHDGRRLASWSWDGTARLWDVPAGTALLRSMGEVRAFRKDDKQILHLREAAGGAFEASLAEVVEPLGFTALAGSGRDRAAKRDACFSPDGRLLLSASLAAGRSDGLGVFDLVARKEIAFLRIGGTRCVLFDRSGDSFFSSSERGFFRWPLRRDGGLLRIGPPQRLTDDAGRFDFAPDGRTCAILGGIGKWRLTILDVENPADRQTFPCQFGVAYVDVSAGGRWVAVGTWNGKDVQVWDLPGRRHVHSHPTIGTASVAFSPDERLLVVDGDGLEVIETSSWSQRRHVPGRMHRLHFSADGRILAAQAAFGPGVLLWNAVTFEPIAVLESPDTRPAGELAFSADGSLLAVPTVDAHVVHLWDLRALRGELARMGLDWSQPPYPPAGPEDATLLRVEIDVGELAPKYPQSTMR